MFLFSLLDHIVEGMCVSLLSRHDFVSSVWPMMTWVFLWTFFQLYIKAMLCITLIVAVLLILCVFSPRSSLANTMGPFMKLVVSGRRSDLDSQYDNYTGWY